MGKLLIILDQIDDMLISKRQQYWRTPNFKRSNLNKHDVGKFLSSSHPILPNFSAIPTDYEDSTIEEGKLHLSHDFIAKLTNNLLEIIDNFSKKNLK